MKKTDKFLKNNFSLFVFLILHVAIFLRFYDYLNRFGLGYDQAHDAIIGLFAFRNNLIPLLGPFSSAGPFQTGGAWYLFIMSGIQVVPSWLSPWIFMTIVHVIFVYIMIRVGESIVDKQFGLIAGLLAAVSTAQIAQSTNLTNQGPQAIISLFAIYAAVSWIMRKKTIALFFLGFFISLGISIHMQAAAMLLLLPLALLFGGLRNLSLKKMFIVFFGLFIPYVPLLTFDIQNEFVNLNGMIQYLLDDQYKISLDVLGRRWLTYAGVFWPTAWGHIIGGQTIISFLTIFGVALVFIFSLFKRTLSKFFFFLVLSFFFIFLMLRYIRAPLYDSYLVFLNPFILFMTAWFIYFLMKRHIAFGLLVLLVVVNGSIAKDIAEINNQGGRVTRLMIQNWKSEIENKYPGQKFSFYDYNFNTKNISVPFVYYMYFQNRTSDDGLKIGIAYPSKKKKFDFQVIAGKGSGYNIYLLESSEEKISKFGWGPINPSYIYNSTQNWRK